MFPLRQVHSITAEAYNNEIIIKKDLKTFIETRLEKSVWIILMAIVVGEFLSSLMCY